MTALKEVHQCNVCNKVFVEKPNSYFWDESSYEEDVVYICSIICLNKIRESEKVLECNNLNCPCENKHLRLCWSGCGLKLPKYHSQEHKEKHENLKTLYQETISDLEERIKNMKAQGLK